MRNEPVGAVGLRTHLLLRATVSGYACVLADTLLSCLLPIRPRGHELIEVFYGLIARYASRHEHLIAFMRQGHHGCKPIGSKDVHMRAVAGQPRNFLKIPAIALRIDLAVHS